ncbi:MAG: Gfo/Idh/MocA family protein, partial [Planctomycetota bacterium]|jgi:predicted dehydrogenase
VIVATPTGTHAEIAKYAIHSKLHIFVEKPFALNVQQGEELVAMVKGKKLVNQVGYVIRFNDVFIQVKKLLDAGVLGDLFTFKIEMHGPTLLKDAKNGWRSKKQEGGGCLYDFASHSIDLINYLVGVPDEITGSVLQSIHSVNVEDAVCSTFVYDNNLRGNLLVNWSEPSYRKPAYRVEIFGSKGKIIADLHAYKVFFREKSEFDGFMQGWNQRYITEFAEPVRFYVRGFEFTRQLDYFIDCIVHETHCEGPTFEDGLKTDMTIDRIVKDAAKRRV